MKRCAALCMALLLGGCAGSPLAPVEDQASHPVTPPVKAPTAAGGVRVIPLESAAPGARASGAAAVIALAHQAERERRAGRTERAAAALERALRIEPENADLWQRLAAVRLMQGRALQASRLAERALPLAAGDPRGQARSWRLIERAQRALGRTAAASSAAANARRLEDG